MKLAALTAAALLLGACGELATLPMDPIDEIDPSATLTRVQAEIFTPTCTVVGCHDAIGMEQGLVLIPGTSYGSTVGVASRQVPTLARIQPGSPADSYLYRKVTGSSIVGERMPAASPPLTEAQLRLLRSWILRGAPND